MRLKKGTPVFPNEPLIRVRAKIIEAQLLETAMLLCVNHQTLIATKARRIVKAADGRAIMEFGARRAHNFDSANYGGKSGLYWWCCRDCNNVCRTEVWDAGFRNDGTFFCTVF